MKLNQLQIRAMSRSVALLSLAVASGAVLADTTTPAGHTAVASAASAVEARLPRADSNFLKDAAEAGLAEVEAARTATTKAVHPDVKKFAQQLVDEHTKVNQDLASLAASKNVKLPTEPSLKDKAKLKVLAMRDNQSFDKHFVKSIGVDAHEDAIKLFQKEISDGKDADVRAFAEKNLPALQQHLKIANELKGKTDHDAK